MPIDRQPAPSALPHLEEPARCEWMRAPDPSVPRAAPKAAASPSWICLFRNITPGNPGTKKPDERTAAARRPRTRSIANSASPRLTRRQARANPKTPPKPCPTQPRPLANPEAAIAAADRAAAKTAKETTTNPAAITAITANPANPAATANLVKTAKIAAPPAITAARAAKAVSRAAARCQNPPSSPGGRNS